MAKRFLTPLNITNLASNPASGSEGDLYYNTTDNDLKIYSNGSWTSLSSSASVDLSIYAISASVETNIDDLYENIDTLYEIVYDEETFYPYIITASAAAYNSASNYTNSQISALPIFSNSIFSNISTSPSSQLISADSNSDTLTFIAGENISITAASASDSITINSTGNYTSVDSIAYPDYIVFDTTPESTSASVGTLAWDTGEGNLSLQVTTNSNIGIGQEIIVLCRNGEATQLNKGEVVRLAGAQGQRPLIMRAYNQNDTGSALTIGIVNENIAVGAEGFVITQGIIRNIDTNGFNEGDTLYLSASAGVLTNVKPQAPSHMLVVGVVVKKNASSGRIYVKPINGFELDELHNVKINGISNNDILLYNSASSIWINSPSQNIINTASAAAVTYLVDSAPNTLNTLNELAAALNDDANFATTITNSLASKLNTSTYASASANFITPSGSATLTNKTINLNNNTFIGGGTTNITEQVSYSQANLIDESNASYGYYNWLTVSNEDNGPIPTSGDTITISGVTALTTPPYSVPGNRNPNSANGTWTITEVLPIADLFPQTIIELPQFANGYFIRSNGLDTALGLDSNQNVYWWFGNDQIFSLTVSVSSETSVNLLTTSAASATYLTQAAGLTAATASATYLTQVNASATYATKTELNNINLSSAIQTASAAAVTYLVDAAPEALNTLNELAAALNDDPNYATTITNSLASKLNSSTASATYLTQANASATYLTQSSASTLYEAKEVTTLYGPVSNSTGSSTDFRAIDINTILFIEPFSPIYLDGYNFNTASTSWIYIEPSRFTTISGSASLQSFANDIRGKNFAIDGSIYDWDINQNYEETNTLVNINNEEFLITGTYWEYSVNVQNLWIQVNDIRFQNYVDQMIGSSTFINPTSFTIKNPSVTYLTTTTGLTPATASATYLTQTSASSTYLTKSSASATYLTQTSASALYDNIEQTMTIAISDETTAITTGTAKLTMRSPFAMTLTKVPRFYLKTASSSGNPTVDINSNGTSIFSTTLSIDANEKTSTTAATPAVLSATTIADDTEITFDIDTAGTGAVGAKIILYYKRS